MVKGTNPPIKNEDIAVSATSETAILLKGG
jgi:hypothetical protein